MSAFTVLKLQNYIGIMMFYPSPKKSAEFVVAGIVALVIVFYRVLDKIFNVLCHFTVRLGDGE